jgi:hypothetical protein
MASAIAQRGQPQTEDGYIKCRCNNCDNSIEFPAHGVGQTIACPHCGMETTLFKAGAPSIPMGFKSFSPGVGASDYLESCVAKTFSTAIGLHPVTTL